MGLERVFAEQEAVGADWRDLAALRAALRADVPLIGVCRGHQLLNIRSGGSL